MEHEIWTLHFELVKNFPPLLIRIQGYFKQCGSKVNFHWFEKSRGLLSGGTNKRFRPKRLAIWLSSELAETVLVYIIVVEPKMSSPNPHASKNGLKHLRKNHY